MLVTFEEQLPALVVLGYAATGILTYFGVKLGARTKSRLGDGERSDAAPGVRQQLRAATTLTALAWVVGLATTVTWLVFAVGVNGLVMIFTLLVLLPFAGIYLGMLAGRLRKRRAGGEVEAIWPRMLLGGGALCFLVVAANSLMNGLMYFVGLAYEVDLNVTHSYQGSSLASRTTVSGNYLLHGETQVLDDAQWLAFEPLPDPGDTIHVAIAPLWPNPLLANATNAGMLLTLGVVAAIPGILLTVVVARERASVRNRGPRSAVKEGEPQGG